MGRSGRGWTRVVLVAIMLIVLGVGLLGLLLLPTPPEVQDVVYGEAGGKSLKLDIYRPAGATKSRPGVLLIHGGGWVEGDKSSQRDLARHLTRAGFVAIAVGYRLAKDDASRHPAQIEDVQRAVRWVRAHAGEVGVDPDRLGAFGHSAGGHLAAILGTTDSRESGNHDPGDRSSRVNCVVDCCGPADFTDESSPPVGQVIAWMVPNLFGKTRAEAPDAYRDASPVAHVDARSAPTLIIHGTDDDVVPIDQSRKLRDALAKAGVEAKLVELEGQGHVFQGQAAADRMIQEAMAFLERHLKR